MLSSYLFAGGLRPSLLGFVLSATLTFFEALAFPGAIFLPFEEGKPCLCASSRS